MLQRQAKTVSFSINTKQERPFNSLLCCLIKVIFPNKRLKLWGIVHRTEKELDSLKNWTKTESICKKLPCTILIAWGN